MKLKRTAEPTMEVVGVGTFAPGDVLETDDENLARHLVAAGGWEVEKATPKTRTAGKGEE